MTDEDETIMQLALSEALKGQNLGEVPIGAIIYDPSSKTIVARAHNSPIASKDPCAHAEILAIRHAGSQIGNYRLNGLWLYVTLEPCAMCAGAISHARLERLIYAAPDPKGGAVEHGPRFFEHSTCHHAPKVRSGLLSDTSRDMLKAFFKDRRKPVKPE